MENYNKVINQLRELARDGLRLNLMARLRAEKYDLELSHKVAENELKVLEYDLSKQDKEHPNYESIASEADKAIEYQSKVLVSMEDLMLEIENSANYWTAITAWVLAFAGLVISLIGLFLALK